MILKVLDLTLLNHLFYYTEVAGGATSSSATGDFIGDLALTYAFDKALNKKEDYYLYRKKPDYEEIKDFGFYCTVAKPIKRNERTDTYINNTLFNTDGFVDIKAIEKSGKSPFKNFRQVQGIRTGGNYRALLIAREEISLPKVIRVGRALETLVLVNEIKGSSYHDDNFCLNAFTLKTVFDNLDKTVNLLIQENKVNFSKILENYNLIQDINLDDIDSIFKGYF